LILALLELGLKLVYFALGLGLVLPLAGPISILAFESV